MPQQHSGKYGDNFADVGAQEEPYYLANVGVDATAFPDSVYNGGEVVVGQSHIRRALCHIRAGNAHSTADVSGFQGGSIVHAVTRHGNHLVLALPGLHNADFVFRGYPGVNRNVFYFFIQLFVRHGVQLRTGNCTVSFFQDAQFLGNSRSGYHMVAGNHHRFNASLAAGGNGGFCFRTRRVDHAHQAHEGQTVFQLLRGGICRNLPDFFISNGQHPQGILAHLFVHPLSGFYVAFDAAGSHHIKCALDNDDIFPVDFIDGSHQLPVGIEGDFRQAGIGLVQLFLGHPVFVSGHDNGGFRGVADVLFLAVRLEYHRAIAAKGAVTEQLLCGFRILAADFFQGVGTVQPHFGEGHAVLGQGTGFIRADNRCAAQGFHGGQAAD